MFKPQTATVDLMKVTEGTELFPSTVIPAAPANNTSTNLFGSLNASKKLENTSLFGGAVTAQQATDIQAQGKKTGSLLMGGSNNTTAGGLGSTQQPQAGTSSLFGGQPKPFSGFGTLGGGQTTGAGQGTGLLGGNAGGSQATAQAPQGSSLLGALGGNQGAAGASLLGNNLPSQNKPAEQQGHGQGQGQNNVRSAYFNSLLERNKKRTHRDEEATGFEEVPSLQLGLGDISKRVRELGGVGAQNRRDRAADSKA